MPYLQGTIQGRSRWPRVPEQLHPPFDRFLRHHAHDDQAPPNACDQGPDAGYLHSAAVPMLGLARQERIKSCCIVTEREDVMPESVYKVIELVGTSKESWAKAASTAVEQAAKTLRDLRVAEVVEMDMQLDAKGKVEAYRVKLNISFKFEGT